MNIKPTNKRKCKTEVLYWQLKYAFFILWNALNLDTFIHISGNFKWKKSQFLLKNQNIYNLNFPPVAV